MSGDLAAVFGTGFDAEAVEPQDDFQVIPPGKYPVLVEKAEVRQTRKGDGRYIGLVLQILDGPCKGRKVFDNINIENPNQQAVEIGMRSLSALARAIGVMVVNDTSQLLNQCCIASVKVKDGDNNVRTYEPLQQPQQVPQQAAYQQPQQPPQQAVKQPAPQQPGNTAPPWAR